MSSPSLTPGSACPILGRGIAPLRLATASLLALLYLGAALLPCPPTAPTTGSTVHAHEADEPGAHHGHAEPGAAHHAPSPERANPLELAAPCPCGCGDHESATAKGGKLGPSLASTASEPAPVAGVSPRRVASLEPTPSLVLARDEIPI